MGFHTWMRKPMDFGRGGRVGGVFIYPKKFGTRAIKARARLREAE